MLDACPICRTTLREPVQRCPDCGADLQPFIDRTQRVSELIKLARNLLQHGQTREVEQLLPQLSHLDTVSPAVLRELNARLALSRRDSATARSLAEQLESGAERDELLRQCGQLDASRQQARELYNSALWLARQGSFAAACEELQRAAGLDPHEARIWLLKLKVELKAGLYARCYQSLAALDRLHARPAEFARLDSILPAAAAA